MQGLVNVCCLSVCLALGSVSMLQDERDREAGFVFEDHIVLIGFNEVCVCAVCVSVCAVCVCVMRARADDALQALRHTYQPESISGYEVAFGHERTNGTHSYPLQI